MKMTKEEAFKMLQGKKVYAGEFAKEVQEKLFEIGFKWGFSWKELRGYNFILLCKFGMEACCDFDYFNKFDAEEITISQILGIELEDEFKDGDILHSDWNGECINFIFKKSQTEDGSYFYYTSTSKTLGLIFDNRRWSINTNPRLATEQEKQTLFNELDKQGYKWSAEEKKLKKKLWRAKYRENYYYFDSALKIYKDTDVLSITDDNRYNILNYFKTKDEAQKYSDKIKELLQNREA